MSISKRTLPEKSAGIFQLQYPKALESHDSFVQQIDSVDLREGTWTFCFHPPTDCAASWKESETVRALALEKDFRLAPMRGEERGEEFSSTGSTDSTDGERGKYSGS